MVFPSAPVAEQFERVVTATAAEFERDLRMAWPDGVQGTLANGFMLSCGDVRLDVAALPNGIRRLGILELPVLLVRYRFTGGDDSSRRRFLHRLDRSMQRGGG